MLTEDSLRIREAAASSLVRIKATDKIDRILTLVSDNDVWVAYFAVKAVGELCKSPRCADALIGKYASVDTQVKIAIIEALGKMDIDYSDFIFQLMDDENEDIRKEALNTLFCMNKKVAVEAAYGALKDQSWIVRFKAVEILEKLKPEGCIEKLKKVASVETNRYVKEKILSIVGEL
jgi:HEAT repeat protein